MYTMPPGAMAADAQIATFGPWLKSRGRSHVAPSSVERAIGRTPSPKSNEYEAMPSSRSCEPLEAHERIAIEALQSIAIRLAALVTASVVCHYSRYHCSCRHAEGQGPSTLGARLLL